MIMTRLKNSTSSLRNTGRIIWPFRNYFKLFAPNIWGILVLFAFLATSWHFLGTFGRDIEKKKKSQNNDNDSLY